ncbi:MAG: hypothetical protein ACI94Y_000876 [Maribacter sp.]|jgi:hypothetical protein
MLLMGSNVLLAQNQVSNLSAQSDRVTMNSDYEISFNSIPTKDAYVFDISHLNKGNSSATAKYLENGNLGLFSFSVNHVSKEAILHIDRQKMDTSSWDLKKWNFMVEYLGRRMKSLSQ